MVWKVGVKQNKRSNGYEKKKLVGRMNTAKEKCRDWGTMTTADQGLNIISGNRSTADS